MIKCAVLGSPISHSLSPLLHRTAYEELGIEATYDAIEVDEKSFDSFSARQKKKTGLGSLLQCH